MSGNVNDNISASMLVGNTQETTVIMIETTSGPESPVGNLALEDLLQKAFTPGGKLRVLMT